MRYAEALLIIIGGLCMALAAMFIAPAAVLITTVQRAGHALRGTA